MIEVTSSNFESILPQVEKCIENASFVAIDTEFTGLPSGQQKSLFDSLEDRYEKLRHEVPRIIIFQFGLTTFAKDLNENRYKANSFTFYLRPPSFGSVDKIFSVQASALRFLYRYDFDFNKSFKDGIQYMNEEEARNVEEDIRKKSFLSKLDGEYERECLQEVCGRVAQWLIRSKEEIMVLDETSLQGIDDYVVLNVIREKNPSCWVCRNADKKITVTKVTPERRLQLERETAPQEDLKFFQTLQGFSRVFRKLAECKKPVVGHNCLCDLLLTFQQFHRPLPPKLKTFREELLSLFPVIFDTKHICLDIKKALEDTLLLGRGDLSKLYTTLLRSPTSSPLYYSPEIYLEGVESVNVTPHQAGFDSYASGFVFLKLAHLLAIRKLEGRSKPMMWVEHMDALAPFQNKVNLIRSGDHFLDLSGGKLCQTRPKWLFIETKSSCVALDVEKLTDILSSYGTVDIKPLNRHSAVLAVANIGCARDIARAFHQSTVYNVTSYSHLRHSTSGRLAVWSALACFTGFSLALVIQLVKLAS